MRKITTKEVAETILEQILFLKCQRPGTNAKMRDLFVTKLVDDSQKYFFEDATILHLEPPVVVVGGLFGYFYDLLTMFETFGHPPAHVYVFLGDVIGKGPQSLETILMLLCYKVLYPNNIYIIRGYNEIEIVNARLRFKTQVTNRYSVELWNKFNKLFGYFPLGAVLADQILLISSGISNEYPSLDELAQLDKPIDIGKSGPLFDLLSSIPDHMLNDWCDIHRSKILSFGINPVKEFCQTNNLKMIIRSHTIVDDGFEFPLGGDEAFLTISTIPSYDGRIEKTGMILEIDNTLKIEFRTIRPIAYHNRDYYDTPASKKNKPKTPHVRTKPM